jgi:hypothetical protein
MLDTNISAPVQAPAQQSQQTLRPQQLDPDVQWFMLNGTKPALSASNFGSSRSLYDAVNRRFALMDQFHSASAQGELGRFAQSLRPAHVEASRVILPSVSGRELYVMAPKGHKQEAEERLAAIIKKSPAVQELLRSPDLVQSWAGAATVEGSVVGGYDLRKGFMFALSRPALEDMKSLFGVHENFGRYKPRPERDPAFFSRKNIGMAVVQFPEQIEKAFQHLQYFKRASMDMDRPPKLILMVSLDVAKAFIERLRDLRDTHDIEVVATHARAIAERALVFCKHRAETELRPGSSTRLRRSDRDYDFVRY